ncbi:MAG: hypothetical protein KatS3mg017_0976 [Fimbriimonadales bacterium]|nr:MAG: hypothetical protein KatS3mg017_0976 [Fimbriimonadales bacterium]
MRDESLIRNAAEKLKTAIDAILPKNPNEAELRAKIEKQLEAFLHAGAHLLPSPRLEVTLASGRADAVFNRFVIEYKRPGVLSKRSNHKATQHAVKQLRDYLSDLAQKERHEVHRVAGVVFDGCLIIFARFVDGAFTAEAPQSVSVENLERMLTWLTALASGVALTADNLARDFGIEQYRTQQTLRALYTGLQQATQETDSLVSKLFEQWRILFSEAIDYSEAFGGGKLEQLQKWARKAGFDIRSAYEAEQFFFVLHTYFALLVKLIARLAVMRALLDKVGVVRSYQQLADLPSDALQEELQKIESGDLFRQIGIQNLLEGDFFAWYLRAWNAEIERGIRQLLQQLSHYDPTTLTLVPEETRDLFKKLYHYLLPREVRHNLGEYYTPDWLAERLLRQMDNTLFADSSQPNERTLSQKVLQTRFLDPACGSGTFLVLILRRLMQLQRNLQPALSEGELLKAITQNVVGFDINPLAVLTARVNYLLAIADLLPYRKGELSLPVYLADSVLMPAFSTDMFQGSVYLFRTAVGEFKIPTALCTPTYFNRLCDMMEECVLSGVSADAFLQRVSIMLSQSPTGEVVPYHGVDERGNPVRELPEYLKQLCREARMNPTPPEAFLWECLRDRRLNGLKFRRQHAIGRYIADFYCHEARLIIELEGSVHDEPQQATYDAIRFETLQAQGFRVLRIRNEELRDNPQAVLARILEAALAGTYTSPFQHPHPHSPAPFVQHPHSPAPFVQHPHPPTPLSQEERGERAGAAAVPPPLPLGEGAGGEGVSAGGEGVPIAGGGGIPPTGSIDYEPLRETYQRMLELHQQGLNGLWARILKNNFAPLTVGQFDYIVGNPPWINWEHLPDNYRDSIRKLWEQYKLPSQSGGARLGAVKGDFSALMTLVVADKLLKPNGKLGFVITQSLFKTAAGAGFRRFTLPGGTPLKVLLVEDMVDLNPFEGASNRTAVLVLLKGQPTRYPVSYTLWRKKRDARFTYTSTLGEVKDATTRHPWFAEPAQPNAPTSQWLTVPQNALKAIRKVMGNADYEAHEGANTGGANAVYWLEKQMERPDGLWLMRNLTEGAKRKVKEVVNPLESELLYPLLRGRDVQRWHARPSAWILVPRLPTHPSQVIDLNTMQLNYPKTYAYLKQFEDVLRTRRDAMTQSALRRGEPFYFYGAVNDYTFAPWKVVWREMASRMTAAVVGGVNNKPVIPDHKLMLVDFTSKMEAHYVCACLNSSIGALFAKVYAVETQMNPHILEHIRIPRYDPANALHRRLAALSREAHQCAQSRQSTQSIEAEIDQLAAQLWGLTPDELKAVQQALQILTGDSEANHGQSDD